MVMNNITCVPPNITYVPLYSVRPCPLLLLAVRGGHYRPRIVGREYAYVGRSSEAGARAKIIWDRSAGGAAAAYIIGAWKFRGMSGKLGPWASHAHRYTYAPRSL